MQRTSHIARVIRTAAWVSALVPALVCAQPHLDGGLLREREPYPSYAEDRYISYNAVVPSRGAVYDRMGQFVNYGVYGLRWNEMRDRYTADKMGAGVGLGDINATSTVFQESNFFNFLAVVRQSFGGRSMSMALGRNMSTSFTPLVLNNMTYGGLRVDYASPRHDLTFLLSRGGSLEASLLYSRLRGDQRGFEEVSPVLVAGGNWKGQFGGLQLGATFFRQLQSNIQSKPGALFNGDIPYPEFRSPKRLKVRISDDSPRDLDGVALYAAHVYLRAMQIDSTEVFYSSDAAAAPRYTTRTDLMPIVVEGRPVEGHYEAESEERIVVDFDLQALYAEHPGLVVTEADIELMVDGDYRIGMRQIYDFQRPDGVVEVDRSWPISPTGQFSLDQFEDHQGQSESYFTVLRSEGSTPLDGTPERVRFQHAIPTAQTFYGANLEWLHRRFHLKGEFVANPQDFKFPTQRGGRRQEMSRAGYLTLKGKMGRGGDVGIELFHMDPTYGGWYDSRRGGLVLHTDVAEQQAGVQNAVRAMTQEFRTYDDNDDHDNWPDDYPGSADVLYMARGSFERPTYPSSRPEGGVYPGLDMDGDYVLDHDKNRNAVEDYIEPFIGYDSDPPEFVYGLDLNNNLVPDFRENDDEPDYPYRRDQRGVHLFYDLQSRPWWLSGLRLGWYGAEEIAGGHQMRVLYARGGVQLETPSVYVALRDDVKRVRDDIADDTYRLVLVFDPGSTGTRQAVEINQNYNSAARPPLPDFLPMRNSLVNTAHLDSRWMPLRGLQIANAFKYVLNRKMEDVVRGTVLQEPETLHTFSMVNKASYTRQMLPQLTMTARVKHLLAQWDEGNFVPVDTLGTSVYVRRPVGEDGSVLVDTVRVRESRASWSFITPELILSYALTPRTRIELGQHGFFLPLLKGRLIDREIPANSYEQNVSLLQLTMQGAYGGYRMVTSVGLRRENIDLDRRSIEGDTDLTAFFVDVIFSPE